MNVTTKDNEIFTVELSSVELHRLAVYCRSMKATSTEIIQDALNKRMDEVALWMTSNRKDNLGAYDNGGDNTG